MSDRKPIHKDYLLNQLKLFDEKILKDKFDEKVNKVSGKGLSTNDFTNTYKSAIDNLPTSYWTAAINCDIGANSCVFTDTNIKTTSIIDAYNENESGTPVNIYNFTITNGQCVITFEELTEPTSFKLHIM